MSYTFRGTPRPWLYAPHMKEQDKAIIICADDGTRYHRSIPVATIHENAQHPEEGEANAHLIAAALLRHGGTPGYRSNRMATPGVPMALTLSTRRKVKWDGVKIPDRQLKII